jgi:DNA polymerase I
VELRIKLNDERADQQAKKERAKKAQSRKKEAETMAEAWERVLALKNDPAEQARFLELKHYMDEGVIHRDPAMSVDKNGKPKKFSKAEAKALYKQVAEIKRKELQDELLQDIPANYHLVQTVEQLGAMVEDLRKETYIGFDIETTGTHVYNDRAVGFVLSTNNSDNHYYVPTKHDTKEPQLPHHMVVEALRPFFESKDYKKIAFHGKFDIHMCYNEGVEFKGFYFDVKTAMHVLNENEKEGALKPLVTKYLRIPSRGYGDIFGNVGFQTVDNLTLALAYAAKDGDVTMKFWRFQEHHLKRTDLFDYYVNVEAKVTPLLVKMERAGFVVDKVRLEQEGQKLAAEIEVLDKQMREAFGVDGEFNFNSSAQMTDLLYNKLKLGKKLPMGAKRNADKHALKKLKDYHPGIALLLEYREKATMYGTFVKGIPEKMQPDGTMHGEFNNDKTVTGRLSSENPNLQNQPKHARPMYMARKGYIMLSADFSQQEPRILCHMSGDEALRKPYREGKDLYAASASEIYEMPIEDCMGDAPVRKMLKMGILAVMYGTTPPTLAQQLKISVDEAEEFIDTFFTKYSGAKQWQADILRYARRNGYIRMLGGRKRRLPDINAREAWKVRRAQRQTLNSIIQGSAAVQTKITMVKLDEWAEDKPGFGIALQVHDEIGMYVPDTITPEEVAEFENIMLNSVALEVPNKVDVEAAYRWNVGVEWDSTAKGWRANGELYHTPREALNAIGEHQ